jgi:phage virion morphogenesis protein
VQDTATAKMKAMAERLGDLTPLMQRFGQHMMPSVRQNFAVGGRPTWTPGKFEVAPAKGGNRRAKRRQGRTRNGGLLVLTGDLRGHIDFYADKRDLMLRARPTQNGVKAAVHQWGVPDTEHGGSGRLAGRGNTVAIPARPYLVFQKEDIAWFRASADGWIRVGRHE